ncbi:MAG: polysaccharide deacetylase family protein [Actinobacteria bacterium]|nr:polysaccharide deacetylase family protein [Actinomycetota bacterium]
MNDSGLHQKLTSAVPPRDLIGYGPEPPTFSWPGGARLAVNVVINYEEGSEASPLQGDANVETLVEAPYVVPAGTRNLFLESTYEFGSRVGIWRLLKLLDQFQIAPTFFACAQALELNPAVVEALVERGCDVVGHGYRWRQHINLTPAEQAEDIARCKSELERLTGRPMLGWFTRPPNTEDTQRLLSENDVVYDCGAVNDDIPYFIPVEGRPLLTVPYSLDVNDIRFWKGQLSTAVEFEEYGKAAFDVLYAESAATPRMMSIGLHPRVIGRPARLLGLERLLRHIAGHDDVWFAPRDEIARFWLREFGPADAWHRERADAEPAKAEGKR